MILDKTPYSFDRVVRMALAAGLLWGVITTLGYLSDVLHSLCRGLAPGLYC